DVGWARRAAWNSMLPAQFTSLGDMSGIVGGDSSGARVGSLGRRRVGDGRRGLPPAEPLPEQGLGEPRRLPARVQPQWTVGRQVTRDAEDEAGAGLPRREPLPRGRQDEPLAVAGPPQSQIVLPVAV